MVMCTLRRLVGVQVSLPIEFTIPACVRAVPDGDFESVSDRVPQTDSGLDSKESGSKSVVQEDPYGGGGTFAFMWLGRGLGVHFFVVYIVISAQLLRANNSKGIIILHSLVSLEGLIGCTIVWSPGHDRPESHGVSRRMATC